MACRHTQYEVLHRRLKHSPDSEDCCICWSVGVLHTYPVTNPQIDYAPYV